MLEFCKASPLKRLAALVIDLILLLAITLGVVAAMYSSMDYAKHEEQYEISCQKYSEQFGVDLTASRTEQSELSDEEIAKYTKAWEAFNADETAMNAVKSMLGINLLSLAVGFFAAYLILELLLPLIFGNGQTIGKKILGLCVMHKYHVRVGTAQMIFRTILGKYFIETLIPVVMFQLRNYGALGTTASLVLAGIAMTQGFFVLMSQANCGIHDKLFKTVVADFNEQYIFDTLDERIDFEEAYEEELAKREAAYGG
jgi:uncharacterized RDD family membrane protein YckC